MGRSWMLALLILIAGAWTTPSSALVVGPGWDGPGRGAATVSFSVAGPDMQQLPDERGIIIDALENWVTAASLDITFNEVKTRGLPESIDFHFIELDGPLGGLGFAFFPHASEPTAGDVFFDESETWTGGRTGPGTCNFWGCDLYYVALHEIGHALGLAHPDHSANTLPARVMNPFFNGGWPPGFGAFDSIQPADIADVCSAYSCTGAGAVRPIAPATRVPEPPTSLLLLPGLLAMAARLCIRR